MKLVGMEGRLNKNFLRLLKHPSPGQTYILDRKRDRVIDCSHKVIKLLEHGTITDLGEEYLSFLMFASVEMLGKSRSVSCGINLATVEHLPLSIGRTIFANLICTSFSAQEYQDPHHLCETVRENLLLRKDQYERLTFK